MRFILISPQWQFFKKYCSLIFGLESCLMVFYKFLLIIRYTPRLLRRHPSREGILLNSPDLNPLLRGGKWMGNHIGLPLLAVGCVFVILFKKIFSFENKSSQRTIKNYVMLFVCYWLPATCSAWFLIYFYLKILGSTQFLGATIFLTG